MKSTELFQQGSLTQAIAAALEEVKAKPSDLNLRSFLAELLAFSGEFEKADKQLDTLSTMHVDTAIGVALFRQLLRAERWRSQCFLEGRVPEFVNQPSEEMQLRLKATVLLRDGAHAEAVATLNQAETLRKVRGGTCNGAPFDDIRDLDDVLGSVVEVLTSNGTYYWLPLDEIDYIELHPVKHARDQLWRGALIDMSGTIKGEIYIPTLYPQSGTNADERVRVGRTTDWVSPCEGVVRGQGQKMWLVGEEAIPILQLSKIEYPITEDSSAMEAEAS
jgi:type VI secretion system protein ImpE